MGGWLRQVEELKLASLDRGTRVLAISSPSAGSGSSELASLLADASHRAGQRTLLVDLARSAQPAAPLWTGQMVLLEEAGLASGPGVRALRHALQATLGRLRLTRHMVDGIALAASDMSAEILDEARPNRIGLRIVLAGAVLKVEIMHDGQPMPGLVERLGPPAETTLVAPGDRLMPFLLARRTLPRWSYSEGHLNRLVGWCTLDGTTPGDEPPAEDTARCEHLVANPAGRARAQFNNVEEMRKLLHVELAAYQAIVIDLPPVLDESDDHINPLAAMAAADGSFLLCMAGRIDRSSLARTMTLVKQSGVELLGIVVNDAENPSLGAELAREARRIERILPRFSRWLQRKALAAGFIN
ncbi:MAG: hypothetical protein R3D27_06790 [Hyphomicrobiaceae bacterium]